MSLTFYQQKSDKQPIKNLKRWQLEKRTRRMGKYPKINFFAKLIVSKPENNFLKRKASIEI